MKIEMGESLFYSWLRHVKECQIVQTNWKPSRSWHLSNEDEIRQLMKNIDDFFQNKYGYAIFKKNSFYQFLSQAEVDVLGLSILNNYPRIYAVDVAFHESGLNYSGRQETVEKVIKKFVRTVFCFVGYFDVREGEIIFASPKINNAIIKDLMPCINDLAFFLNENKYHFTFKVIANDVFYDLVLKPILISSDEESDTSELFMRSYQLMKMFDNKLHRTKENSAESKIDNFVSADSLSELKIGKIAQTILKEALEGNVSDEEEIIQMQMKEYSKKTFGINYPLLTLASGEYEKARYYKKPLNIRGKKYLLCSQWFEVPENNDRPLLIAWLEKHGILKPGLNNPLCKLDVC